MYMYVPYYLVILLGSKLASTFQFKLQFTTPKVFRPVGFIDYSEPGSLTKQPLQLIERKTRQLRESPIKRNHRLAVENSAFNK